MPALKMTNGTMKYEWGLLENICMHLIPKNTHCIFYFQILISSQHKYLHYAIWLQYMIFILFSI